MQLRAARLCLNCDEVHDARECPACGSEVFTYITRWIPAPERREMTRPPPQGNAETYRQLLAPEPVRPWGMRWARRGALGLLAVSVGRWMWQRRAGEVASRAEPLPRGPAPKAASQEQTAGEKRPSALAARGARPRGSS
jgi:predicted  nucleic acid-binding Zn-ribbon protein